MIKEKIREIDDLNVLTDDEIIIKIHDGNKHAYNFLIKKYDNIVRHKVTTYFLIGSDREDVIQEGYIGLYKAICDYNQERKMSFRSFAEMCITRQIITSIKSATRLKHTPLNSYISIYKPVHDDQSERTLLETINNKFSQDPLNSLMIQEERLYIQAQLQKALTRLEHNVLKFYLQGYTYEEMATKLNCREKSIDNALQRIKRKVSEMIEKKHLASI